MDFGFLIQRPLLQIVFLATIFSACDSSEKEVVKNKQASDDPYLESTKLPAIKGLKTQQQKPFVALQPSQTGIAHVTLLDLNHPQKATYVSGWVCGGVIIADFNNDHSPDLFFPQNAGHNQLYLQKGTSLEFREVAQLAGVGGGDAFSVSGSAGDIDGDGDIDLYLCNYDGPNQLFINQGTDDEGIPQFKELATSAQLDLNDASLSASFCDYDRDGDLDLFVLTNRFYHPTGYPEGKLYHLVDGKPEILPHLKKYYTAIMQGKTVNIITVGRQNRLYRNDGNTATGAPVFTDVTDLSGIGQYGSLGLSCTWMDYNGDGWLDLYVANDFEYDDRLFLNQHDGTFKNVIKEVAPITSYYSMGSVAADFDGDAREDLFVLDMAATSHYKAKIAMGALTARQTYVLDHAEPRQTMRNVLLLNTGTGAMREIAHMAGISKSDWSWTPLAADLDNDGDHDVLITNGMVRDFSNADLSNQRGNDKIKKSEWDSYADTPERPETNLAFENLGHLQFKNIAQKWGLDHRGMSYAAAWADLDLDGKIDIVVSNLNEPPSIYHNRQDNQNHRILITLDQPGHKNPQAIGAQLTIQVGERQQIRTLQPTNGFLSHNHPIIHFGLGSAENIDLLTVRWPDGTRQVHRNLPADCHHRITRRPDPAPETKPRSKPSLFTHHPSLDRTVHVDPKFDDFKLQPLLPNKLSHQGPGHAWADLNGDGTLDFYLAMGAGEPDRIYFYSDGRFVYDSHQVLEADAAGESIAPLIFDIDSDGDNDIYVSRGSYEFPSGDPRQQDRLYLNDGRGRFSPVDTATIPNNQTVSGHVTAADIDHDGDLDLLVTSRVAPGAYPLAPSSRLLRNDSKPGHIKLTDITSTHAPELGKVGMITSAVFSDADNDGATDLLLTTEFGPIIYLRNQQGKFVKNIRCKTLTEMHGWWNSITPSDVDQDGDLDYIVGNLGTNTKYHPTMKNPNFIFYGDMDGSGNRRIVEAKTPKSKLGNDQKRNSRPLPVRGRS